MLHMVLLMAGGGIGIGVQGEGYTTALPLSVYLVKIPVKAQADVSSQQLALPSEVSDAIAPQAVQKTPASKSAGGGLPTPVPRYFTRKELNYPPELLFPLPYEADTFAEFALSASGRAVFWVYIDQFGAVVAVELERESTTLPLEIAERARQMLVKAQFSPGYFAARPVATKLLWEFVLRPSGLSNQVLIPDVRP